VAVAAATASIMSPVFLLVATALSAVLPGAALSNLNAPQGRGYNIYE